MQKVWLRGRRAPSSEPHLAAAAAGGGLRRGRALGAELGVLSAGCRRAAERGGPESGVPRERSAGGARGWLEKAAELKAVPRAPRSRSSLRPPGAEVAVLCPPEGLSFGAGGCSLTRPQSRSCTSCGAGSGCPPRVIAAARGARWVLARGAETPRSRWVLSLQQHGQGRGGCSPLHPPHAAARGHPRAVIPAAARPWQRDPRPPPVKPPVLPHTAALCC
ncbi:hypothetical protein LUU34_01297100 [Aix galericulata]|nr:hypothetical protein LUU34_01297100 [Aix galericulata]